MPKLTGLLLRERTLVAAGHVTTCDNELLTRVGLMYYIYLHLWSTEQLNMS